MKISIITLFPKMISGFFEESIVKRAIEKKLVEIEIVNLRDFATDKYGSVDDRPYGGGAGMIMRVDIIKSALSKISRPKVWTKGPSTFGGDRPLGDNIKNKTIITSPKGKVFNQEIASEFSKLENLIIIAGHYEGIDERVSDYVDEEISLGDFVTTGGEMAAAAIVDAIVRLLPGALKKETATESESFMTVSIKQLIETIGGEQILLDLAKKGVEKIRLLEYPQYTRPEEFEGKKVPPVLLQGDHKKIEEWRLKKAFEETKKKRMDLIK